MAIFVRGAAVAFFPTTPRSPSWQQKSFTPPPLFCKPACNEKMKSDELKIQRCLNKKQTLFPKKLLLFCARKNNYCKIAAPPIALLPLNRIYSGRRKWQGGLFMPYVFGFLGDYATGLDDFMLYLQPVMQFSQASL